MDQDISVNEGYDQLRSYEQKDAILVDLFISLASTHSAGEVKLFFSDLLTAKETRRIATRLRIAVYLKYGYTYDEIVSELGVGKDTIARVATWLSVNGQGYALVVNRLAEIGRIETPDAGSRSARCAKKHTPYTEGFWPIEVLGSIFETVADGRKKAKRRVPRTSPRD